MRIKLCLLLMLLVLSVAGCDRLVYPKELDDTDVVCKDFGGLDYIIVNVDIFTYKCGNGFSIKKERVEVDKRPKVYNKKQ